MEQSTDEYLTIVDDAEFNLLSKLSGDYLHADSDCLTRLEGDKVYVIMREAEWNRMERIRKEVEQEIASQEQVARDVTTQIERATDAELQQPKVEAKPEVQPQYWRFPSDRFRGFGEN
jgi:hypothetical protein